MSVRLLSVQPIELTLRGMRRLLRANGGGDLTRGQVILHTEIRDSLTFWGMVYERRDTRGSSQ